MAIQSSFYTGTALDGRTFPSTKHIATKQHMALWLQEVSPSDAWVQASIDDYQLITNACVLNQVVSQTLYQQLEVRVADEPNELTSSPTDIAIVASIANEIVIVAGIEAEVVIVAGDSAYIQTVAGDTIAINTVAGDTLAINIVAGDTVALNLVSDDLAKGIGTNQPTDSAILNALTNANQTIADVVLTHADVVITNGNVVITNADVVLTHADVVITNADVIASGISATNALASEDKAEEWAENPEDVPVETGQFSALHWAKKAEAFSPTNNLVGIPISNQTDGTVSLDGTTLKITDRGMMFTKGIVDGSAYNTAESNTGIETIIPDNGYTDGINYVYKEEGGLYYSTLDKPNFGSIGYGNSFVDGKWFSFTSYIADGSTNASTTDKVPVMTSAVAPSGNVYVSSEFAGAEGWKAFDATTTTGWRTLGNSTADGGGSTFADEWVVYKGISFTCNKVAVRGDATLSAPKDFLIQGSNDTTDGSDGTWDTLTSVVDSGITDNIESFFTFTNSTAYTAYRIKVTRIYNTGADGGRIADAKFIEAQLDSGTPLVPTITYLDHIAEVASGDVVDIQEFDYADVVLENIQAENIEVSGEFIGENACTAWVNFDGTTTPPTIRDSFNVNDVIRTATGKFQVVFEVPMDISDYVAISNATNESTSTFIKSYCSVHSTSYVSTATSNNSALLTNYVSNSVQIFGGKE